VALELAEGFAWLLGHSKGYWVYDSDLGWLVAVYLEKLDVTALIRCEVAMVVLYLANRKVAAEDDS
jgi:hypothetical protein